jgi:hypothetical protein
VDGRAPRGPCRAVGITRQSARGTWAPARLRWVLAAQCARQFAGCALGAAAWSSRLAGWLGAGEGTGGPGKGLDTPRFASWRVVLDAPRSASWRWFLDTPNSLGAGGPSSVCRQDFGHT